MPTDASYRETIDYLYALQKHGVKLALANTVRLMELMGRPHEKFRSVHVAGTNGKGSTCAFLAQMLGEAGYRVGLYTSPHLVSFTERIRINGVPISEEAVVALTRRVRDAYDQGTGGDGANPLNPTFFEVTTAVAFTYFAEAGVDIAVIETGMGGRLDATNVITPLVTVITNIDLEHTEFLGGTLEQIAAEKAGVIKQGAPVITGARQPEVLAVFEREAALKGAPLARLGREFSPDNIGAAPQPSFDYRGRTAVYAGLRLELLGRHQVDNACLAIAALERLRETGMAAGDDALRRGLARTRWEGRMELLGRKPDLYLDGAHNPASAAWLASLLRALLPSYGKLVLVIGILGDKDYRAILRELAPLAAHVIATQPNYARALSAEALAAELRSFGREAILTKRVEDAISRARSFAAPDDLIVVTGSLYVVGDARATLVPDAGKSGALAGLKG